MRSFKNSLRLVALLFPIFFTVSAMAQNAADCASLMKFGIYDKFKTLDNQTQYKQIQDFFSSYQFNSAADAQAKATSLGVDIVDILGIKFDGTSSSSNFSQWESKLIQYSYQESLSHGLHTQDIQKVSSVLADLVGKCLTQKGVHVYVIPANDNQTFSVTADFVPTGAGHPATKGTITLTPGSVAASCMPSGLLGQRVDIGPQGISVSCRRLPTDTIAIALNTDDGSPTIQYDAYVTPVPVVTLHAADASIAYGGSTTVSWAVTNALRVELDGFGQVLTTGSVAVNPTSTTQYKLTVTSLDGKQASTFVQVVVQPPPPVLTAASVSFHTTDNDKDGDTNVSVYVLCGGTTVASVSGTWGHWNDNSDNGTYQLNVVEHPRKDHTIGACSARLVEAPKGHDEWHFNWSITLTFSDGSVKRYDWGGGNVDYDRTTVTQSL
jgi:hypothetical protein